MTVRDTSLNKLLESRSTRPALLGALMIIAGGVAWYDFLPASARRPLCRRRAQCAHGA